VPATVRPVRAVVEHRLLLYRNTWQGSFFLSFAFPVLLLLSMGKGMGPYVDSGHRLQMQFADFLAPGLLASTVFQLAVTEATFPVMRNLKWTRTYYAALATPVTVLDLVVGDVIALLLRVLAAAAVFLGVMWLFGLVHSAWALLTVPVCGLLAVAVATPVFAYTILQRSEHTFLALYRLGVIPVGLLSGVFFPVDPLPAVARAAIYVSPLWHAVALCRGLTIGRLDAAMVVQVSYLVAWAVPGTALACWAFRRRLVV
jgi:lipooligosaccharide transport system permease protein